MKDSNVGIVIIGRNEAARLQQCIKALPPFPKVYVDSGSTDSSCQIAEEAGIEVLELSPSRPFSAARGRNAGWRYLSKMHPEVKAVQFVDGDTILDRGWISEAWQFLESHSEVAAVYGNLEEKEPDRSLYNRLCALEWKGVYGEVDSLLGMALIRLETLQLIGGYRVQLAAGEDPELALRLRATGYTIYKINRLMGIHDANQHYFSQWWKRSQRYGYAVGESYALHRYHPLSRSGAELRSIILWALWPLVTVFSTPWIGIYALIPFFIWLFQLFKIFRFRQKIFHDTMYDASLYALFCMIAKFPQLAGVITFFTKPDRRAAINFTEETSDES